jgi:hypothetical protein
MGMTPRVPVVLTPHEEERNRFIPTAMKFANKQFGASCKAKGKPELEAWRAKWNFTFHQKMNKLWNERSKV